MVSKYSNIQIIHIPPNVSVNITWMSVSGACNRYMLFEGPKGAIRIKLSDDPALRVIYSKSENTLIVRGVTEEHQDRMMNKGLMGTIKSHILNILKGVSQGHRIQLKLVGVGYRGAIHRNKLILKLGHSNDISIGYDHNRISIQTPKPNIIILRGADLDLLTQYAAALRSYRPPEPYKGKGVFYKDEVIRRKIGKKN